LYPDLPLSESAWILSIPRSVTQVIYTFKPELLIFLSTGTIWWLSQRLAYRTVSFKVMLTEFQFGLTMLALTFFIASGLNAIPDNPVPIVLIFFLLSLSGISVSHAFENTTWISSIHRGHWSGILLVSISVVLVLGFLVTMLISPDLLKLLWSGIKWAWGVICGVILKLFIFLDSLFPHSEPSKLPPVLSPESIKPTETRSLEIPGWLRRSLLLTIGIFWAALIILTLWRISSSIFSWLRNKIASLADVEFESMPGAFRANFLNLLKYLLTRVLRLGFLFRFYQKQDVPVPPVTSVRLIYRRLLRWAGTRGYPRHVSQTPQEYCRALTRFLPETGEELNFITKQYIMVRYGGLPPTEDTIDKLSQAWHRIKKNRLKKPSTKVFK